jgi:general secretion pathway protein G
MRMSDDASLPMDSPERVSKSSPGFTLIELLVVIGIIGVLVGIVLGVTGYANRKAAVSRAMSDIERIKTALEEYRIERGRYYGPASGTVVSLNFRGERFSAVMSNYINDMRLIDPWGNSYEYFSIGDPPLAYRIWSRGPNTNAASTFDDVESGVGNY